MDEAFWMTWVSIKVTGILVSVLFCYVAYMRDFTIFFIVYWCLNLRVPTIRLTCTLDSKRPTLNTWMSRSHPWRFLQVDNVSCQEVLCRQTTLNCFLKWRSTHSNQGRTKLFTNKRKIVFYNFFKLNFFCLNNMSRLNYTYLKMGSARNC